VNRNYPALLRALPLRVIVHRGGQAVVRPLMNAVARRRDLANPTYAMAAPTGPLRSLVDSVPMATIRSNRTWIDATADLYRRHYFDLLGSGWVRVAYGMECAGIGETRFPQSPPVAPDRDGRWLEGRINASNLECSRSIWRLIAGRYVPIDWQLDFKSGFRWSETTWSNDIAFGEVPYVDVKVPWELARLQHLATLAWAYALARDDGRDNAAREWWREYRNQVLDFVATNPPRFGVNWRCTMDVAIRGANLALTQSLFRSAGAPLDDDFERVLKRTLVDHARHVLTHLEWYPEARGNHYLADVAGLVFIAAALPRSGETRAWLAFALQELVAETAHQFNGDGTYFEGSTAYHRLAGEMVVFASALAVGLGDELGAAFDAADWTALRTRPRRPVPRGRPDLDDAHFARIAAMAEFTRAIAKPSGRVPQIGDNDSGHLFKLHPTFAMLTADEARSRYAYPPYGAWPSELLVPDEDALDHRAFVAAAATLPGRVDPTESTGGPWLDAEVVVALMRGRRARAPTRKTLPGTLPAGTGRAAAARDGTLDRTIVLEAPGASLRHGLRRSAWPDFGLWLYRSDRLYLAIRCGRSAANLTNHAHNDQLSFELAIDGVDWIVDPGSFLYAPPRARRDAWRSAAAHAGPRVAGHEPATLAIGNFCLPPHGDGRCLEFSEFHFVGEHDGYVRTVRREIAVGDREIAVRDYGLGTDAARPLVRCTDPAAARMAFELSAVMSPGYGKLLR
jgi:hypothetical protein